MAFLSVLALVLGALVGYSAGAVLAGRGKQVVPGLLDFLVIAALWAAALLLRAAIGHSLSIVVWLLAAGLTSAFLISVRWRSRPAKQERRMPAVNRRAGLLHSIWNGWKGFAAELGNYQGRALMAFFYFIVVTPFGLPVRVFSDRLGLKTRSGSSYWEPQDNAALGLDDARRQF